VCDERKTVRPSALTSPSKAWKLCCTRGSRPEIGSSRINRSGSCMTASIRPSFWRFPRRQLSDRAIEIGVEPVYERVEQAAVDAASKLREIVENCPSGELRIQNEVAREEPEAPTNLDAPLAGVQTRTRADPDVGLIRSSSNRIVVDLPAPFGPTKPKISFLDLQIEPEHAAAGAVVLGEADRGDHRRAAQSRLPIPASLGASRLRLSRRPTRGRARGCRSSNRPPARRRSPRAGP
jgi:hypothetical protein